MQREFVVHDYHHYIYCVNCEARIARVEDYIPDVSDIFYGGYFNTLKDAVIDQPIYHQLEDGNIVTAAKTYCICNSFIGWKLIASTRLIDYVIQGRFFMKIDKLMFHNRVTLRSYILGSAYRHALNQIRSANAQVIGGANAHFGGTNAQVIGGTNAQVIGGTNAHFGGANAQVIGGTNAHFGGANAQVIGGTNAQVIGGANAHFGGANAQVIGGANAQVIGGTNAHFGGANAQVIGGANAQVIGGTNAHFGGANAQVIGGANAQVIGGANAYFGGANAQVIGGTNAQVIGGANAHFDVFEDGGPNDPVLLYLNDEEDGGTNEQGPRQ